MPHENPCTEPKSSRCREQWIALLGRRDEPTDALRDYCGFLRKALESNDISLEDVNIEWYRDGSINSFRLFWRRSAGWTGKLALLQYTALAWSRRGFSSRVLVLLAILKWRGVRCAIVFHDARAYSGDRLIDRCRRLIQRLTMRAGYNFAEKSVFALPVHQIDWLPRRPLKAAYIPIGANIPEIDPARHTFESRRNRPKTVAVFTITGGEESQREVKKIAEAMRVARKNVNGLQLLLLGRNSMEVGILIRQELEGTDIGVEVLGLIPPEDVATQLSSADAMLFIRGPIAGTRSSAVAGIACGLPIVGYGGDDTKFPITEAGLELATSEKGRDLGIALERVLSDEQLRDRLRQKSLKAFDRYFSWNRIGERFACELRSE